MIIIKGKIKKAHRIKTRTEGDFFEKREDYLFEIHTNTDKMKIKRRFFS